jgi:hypothetical protein
MSDDGSLVLEKNDPGYIDEFVVPLRLATDIKRTCCSLTTIAWQNAKSRIPSCSKCRNKLLLAACFMHARMNPPGLCDCEPSEWKNPEFEPYEDEDYRLCYILCSDCFTTQFDIIGMYARSNTSFTPVFVKRRFGGNTKSAGKFK